jgi:hypothetical protein
MSSHQVAFTDLRTNTIRSLDLNSGLLEILGGELNEAVSAVGGGFADGRHSRFNAPYAVVAMGDDRLLIADAGTKRIRELRIIRPGDPVFRVGDSHVAYVGDEAISYAAPWDTSIAGLIQSALGARTLRGVDVVPFVSRSGETLAQMYDDAVGGQHVDVAVVQLSPGLLKRVLRLTDADIQSSQAWAGLLADQFKVLKQHLSGNGTQLILVSYPLPYNFGALEAPLLGILPQRPAPATAETAIARAAHIAGVDLVDLTSAFFAEERSANRVPLFGVDNDYLAAQGRALLARNVAAALEPMLGVSR